MSVSDNILSKDQEVLIAVDDIGANGGTVKSVAEIVERSESSTRRSLGKLEHYGMVRGGWVLDGVWKRVYTIVGEGTADFIRTLREAVERRPIEEGQRSTT